VAARSFPCVLLPLPCDKKNDDKCQCPAILDMVSHSFICSRGSFWWAAHVKSVSALSPLRCLFHADGWTFLTPCVVLSVRDQPIMIPTFFCPRLLPAHCHQFSWPLQRSPISGLHCEQSTLTPSPLATCINISISRSSSLTLSLSFPRGLVVSISPSLPSVEILDPSTPRAPAWSLPGLSNTSILGRSGLVRAFFLVIVACN